MPYALLFLAGALLCNALPHLAAGLRGEPFPTPFARPHGVGHSSALTNFLWGTANLAVGLALAHWQWLELPETMALAMTAAGWLVLGTYCSRHFARVRAGRAG